LRIYESITEKLARYFSSLEMEKEYIFNLMKIYYSEETETMDHHNVNIEPDITTVLKTLYLDLTTNSKSIIKIDDINLWNLFIENEHEDVPEINDHEVPIPIVDIQSMVNSEWELCLQVIIPLINGVNSVKYIRKYSQIKSSRVKMALQNLLKNDFIKMIDIFQFSNRYRVKKEIYKLYKDRQMQEACVSVSKYDQNLDHPNFSYLFSLYCRLNGGMNLHMFCQEMQLMQKNVDVRQWITFGVLNGFVKRLHAYPIKPSQNLPENITSIVNTSYDGTDTLDKINTKLSKSINLTLDQYFITMYK